MNLQMTKPLKQGAVIGILGGGQLGRLLDVAASRMGFRTHEPETEYRIRIDPYQNLALSFGSNKTVIR